jgi:hypothetical protein
MNKKISLIIIIQALLIIALFWMLVFYGKDEYETYQSEQEEEIETLNRVSENDGIHIVNISLAAQQNSGIKTAKVTAAQFQGEIKSFGNVVSIDNLIEAKTNYLNLKSNVDIARASSGQNMRQYQRLKTLNEDDKNVSDRVVQEALAMVNADKAQMTANELQLKNLQNSVKLQWGEALAKLVFADNLPPHLANLLDRKNVLVQMTLPLNTSTPKSGSSIILRPINDADTRIKAIYVSPASTSDANVFGKTFYYSAPAEQLRIGMRVSVELNNSASDTVSGVIVPSSAVVWYAGTSWAYFKQKPDQFLRKPITTDTEVETGWFNRELDVNNEVVVSGAQLLLSEEFKYLIKNENED